MMSSCGGGSGGCIYWWRRRGILCGVGRTGWPWNGSRCPNVEVRHLKKSAGITMRRSKGVA